MSGQSSVELLGLGVGTIDDLVVTEYFPRPNDKQRILSRARRGGGLTASALVAAARLGTRCGYVVTLGVGELSQFLRERMRAEGIALFENDSHPEAEPYLSLILSEQGTGERSILWDKSRARGPVMGEAERAVALSASCLFVDHVWASETLDIVREARRLGIDVVGDFERTDGCSLELMSEVNHLILPLGFARQLLGQPTACDEAASHFASERGRALACVTDGVNGSYYALGARPGDVFHQPFFPMESVVDTTGCGDVFHGVYASCLVKGFPPSERIRWASAAAAVKTQTMGAQSGSPTLEELEAFLRERG